MAKGDNLEYNERLERELNRHLQANQMTTRAPYVTTKTRARGRICKKVSATVPTTDLLEDVPRSLGDICLLYAATGGITSVYVATGGNPYAGTPTCTWTEITA